MAKTVAKLTVGIAALAAATLFGTSPSRAYGDAPWCAVINLGGGDVYWDCQYRTIAECVPNVTGGSRGFCNLNPWPGRSNAVGYELQKRHARKN
jgi:Protein of unknown function (DUF3551)